MKEKKSHPCPPEKGLHTVPMAELAPLICERLAAGQDVALSPRGISMLPLLREGRDTVILTAPKHPLRRFDIPLYQRMDGSFVLHRAVRIAETYTCVGDYQYKGEEVAPDRVIAVVKGILRDGRSLNLTSLRYRLYCRLRHATRPLRYFFYRIKRRIKRLLKKER